MKVMSISKCNLLNGDGCRVVLWVSHCEHHCPFCQNAYCWSGSVGEELSQSHIDEIYEELNKKYISGITFTGGDPLSSKNYEEIIKLSKQIRKDFPDKNQWLWTGYTFEELLELPQKEILKTIDVLCDGRFMIDKLSPNKKWVGSSNQRCISVQASLERNRVILYCD